MKIKKIERIVRLENLCPNVYCERSRRWFDRNFPDGFDFSDEHVSKALDNEGLEYLSKASNDGLFPSVVMNKKISVKTLCSAELERLRIRGCTFGPSERLWLGLQSSVIGCSSFLEGGHLELCIQRSLINNCSFRRSGTISMSGFQSKISCSRFKDSKIELGSCENLSISLCEFNDCEINIKLGSVGVDFSRCIFTNCSIYDHGELLKNGFNEIV